MKKTQESNGTETNGCPVSKDTNSNQGCPVSNPGEKQDMSYSAKQAQDLFINLRGQTEQIEENIAIGEREVLLKDELAFLMRRHEVALSNLINAQNTDFQKQKDRLDMKLLARAERKKAKREARMTIRASKKRDQIIQQQEKASTTAHRVRETINERRAAFDTLTQHMYEIHDKQRKNMIQAQERRFQNEKLLIDLESRHLKEEVRSALQKKFQVRQNHQQHLNKRINDNLREVQLMELRHSKERFELEMGSFEEISNKMIAQEFSTNAAKLRQLTEMHIEKENVLSKHEQEKEELLKSQHRKQLRALQQEQKITLRQMKIKQDQIIDGKRGFRSKDGSKANSQGGSMAGSHVGSKSASMEGSRVGSDESLNSGAKSSVTSSRMAGSRVATALHNNMGLEEVDEDEKGDSSSSTKAVGSLKALIQRHKEELEAIESQCKQEINDCQLQFEAKIQEQQEQQETEVQTCVEEQERQLMELKAIQDKEIQMEESMHDSEMKMLVERRILNSVLQTVADGIINITPIGIIVRFNHAAELMFGYTAQEVIGKNITMLMPERFSRDHHIYLNNYLTTGVKKVIGIGRRVAGLRRNGQEFPLHLSISEMKEDGEHLFTGIARDLTEEVAEENRIAETLLQKQKQLQVLEKKLNSANQDTANLLNEMLPPSISNQVSQGKQIEPQVFPSASVCYLDIVGFSAIAKQVAPLDTLKFLDEVYETINQVVEQYNVYKVETVGDTFVIAAGVPNTNATHASDLATMALHVLQSIDKFRFSMNPDLKVRVRVGINSGPVVAGLVGTKMSRYCLFGDTVTMSSHMTSNGEPGRIHVAEPTYQLLKKDGNFELFKRGKIEVKGRELTTYWVQSKMGFSP